MEMAPWFMNGGPIKQQVAFPAREVQESWLRIPEPGFRRSLQKVTVLGLGQQVGLEALLWLLVKCRVGGIL